MPRTSHFMVAAVLAVAALSSVPACSPGDANQVSYELFPWTHELTAETLSAVTTLGPDDGRMRFHGTPTQLATLPTGDVLLAGASATTPTGVLRQVTKVTTDAGDLVVDTKPVPIQLAFRHLHAKLTGLVPATALASQSLHPNSQHTVSTSVGGVRSVDWSPYDQDGNATTWDDQLYAHGELAATLTLSAYVDLDWLEDLGKAASELTCALSVLCTPDLPDVKLGAKVSADASATIDVQGSADKDIDSGELVLDGTSLDLPPLIGGPLVVLPSIDFVGNITGSATSVFHEHASMKYTASAEVSIGLVSGPNFIPPHPQSQIDPPTVEAMMSADVKAGLGPRLVFLFWGTVGPTVSLTPYAFMHANTEKTPCWTVDVGVDVRAGVTLRIPWKLLGLEELGSALGLSGDLWSTTFGPWSLFETPNVLAGSCTPLPPGVFPPGDGPLIDAYKTPTFTPWSKRFLDMKTTYPYSGDAADALVYSDRSVDGAWFVTGKGIPGVVKVSEGGVIDWVKAVHLPAVDGEVVPVDLARGAVAGQALDTHVWVATSRFTVMKLDQDGDLVWAKRYFPADASLAAAIDPVALVATQDGGALVAYAVQDESKDGPAVLLRVTPNGKLLWAKTFQYETSKTYAPVLVRAAGGDAYVGGFSSASTGDKAHLALLHDDGSVAFAKTLDVCSDIRARPNHGFLLASGALALSGTYAMSPERSFVAQITPDGASATIATWWSGDILKDESTTAAVQLPVSGLMTIAKGLGHNLGTTESLYLTSHDALGAITWQHELTMIDASSMWSMRPAGLRLTTDGGALLLAQVITSTQSKSGLWISKVPARTGDATFDVNAVQTALPTSPEASCNVGLADEAFAPVDLPMKTVDVTSSIVLEAVAPNEDSVIP